MDRYTGAKNYYYAPKIGITYSIDDYGERLHDKSTIDIE